jgi:glutaconyl-CoA decarboxylase
VAKRFRITVNGQAYEVEIEELVKPSAAPSPPGVPPAPISRPEPKPVVNIQPKPAPAARPQAQSPSARPHAAQAGGPASKGLITAPIPGVISEVKVQAGQRVKARDIVIMLEAMKMQNEIMAPHAGTVKEVFVSGGTTVNTGDRLLVIEPE